jgi:type I restriction enzyme S subunit
MTKLLHGTCYLGEVLDITSGFAFKSEYFNENDDGLPLIRCRDVNTGLANVYYSGEYEDQYVVKNGDLLVSMDGDFRVVRWQHGDALLNQRVCRLEPKVGKLALTYLLYFLPKELDRIHVKTSFATVKHLSTKTLREIEIPLPPLAEQKRIADILDKADAIRRKRREAQGQIPTLKSALFSHMFGDIPAKTSRYPFTAFREWITAANGRSSREVLATECTGIPAFGGNGPTGWATRAMYEVPVIVVGRVGQQCGITRTTTGPAWITDNAIAVQIQDNKSVELTYLAAALERSTLGHDVRYIDLPYINQSMILDLPLPLPPIQQQREFATRQESIDKFAAQLASAFNEAVDLFNSLVQRAFKGDL